MHKRKHDFKLSLKWFFGLVGRKVGKETLYLSKKRANKTKPWQNMAKPKVWPNFGLGSPNPVQHPSPPGMARRCLESGWRSCISLCSGPRILCQHRCHGQSGKSVIILCLFFNNFVTKKFSCPILPCKFLYQCICPVLSKTAYSCSYI